MVVGYLQRQLTNFHFVLHYNQRPPFLSKRRRKAAGARMDEDELGAMPETNRGQKRFRGHNGRPQIQAGTLPDSAADAVVAAAQQKHTPRSPPSKAQPRKFERIKVKETHVMVHARDMWRRKDPTKQMAPGEESNDFRSTFGCSPTIACILWELLIETSFLPDGGALEHLLWTLCFMKNLC